MVADELDYVVGVDTHLDEHVLAVVAAPSGAVVARRSVPSSAGGYAAALQLAQERGNGRRVWAIEGTGSYGAGLARYLAGRGETVLEIGRTPRAERRLRGKDDSLDAARTGGQRLPARRSRCRVAANAARHCGCCWWRGAAPSTCAAWRWGSCAA